MSELENQSQGPSLPVTYRVRQSVGSLIGRRFDYLLNGISHGQLSVSWPDGHVSKHGNRDENPMNNAHIELHNLRPIQQMIRSGENGFAESYMRGDWSTENLVALFNVIMNNERSVEAMTTGGWISRVLNAIKHSRNHNSVKGSQRNIEFHYDLGNEFYQLWLDPTMSYSSAIFDTGESLESAQRRKLGRVLSILDPQSGARILEIGCGWGALARKFAETVECHVEGISLSREQLKYAGENNSVLASERHPGSTEFRYQDYRHVNGRYNHIVSIEMFEAVGEQYWNTYFTKLNELLEQGGTALLQVITIAEDRFEQYRASPDFIQRYIFPGGMLPSKTHLQQLVESAGFDLVDTHWFGSSYADTLQHWKNKFDQKSIDVQAQGFDDRFMRMWRYYLSYCETGFRFGRTDVGQLLLCKR